MDTKLQTVAEADKAAYTADNCLSCTSCMSGCPVMEATQEYRGPKLVGPAHSRLRYSQTDTEDSLDFCSYCKSCDRACPSGVAVSTLNMLQRAEYYKKHPHSQRDNMLAHGERMGKLVHTLPGVPYLANLGLKIGKILGIFGMLGLAGKRDIPSYASRTFLNRVKSVSQPKSQKKAVFFPGCFINDNNPEVGLALVKVMNANGYEVLTDERFCCCGSPLMVTGYRDEAKEHADRNVERILYWKNQNIPVIAACTTCSLMLKKDYGEFFAEAKMLQAAKNVYDVFEFLEILDEQGELKTDFRTVNEKLTYHVPCHLKTQGFGVPAQRILSAVPGVKIELADAGCCGMAGSYGFKDDKYAISLHIGERLFSRIKELGADRVISDCGPCRLQISHGTRAKTCHPVEILALAYGK